MTDSERDWLPDKDIQVRWRQHVTCKTCRRHRPQGSECQPCYNQRRSLGQSHAALIKDLSKIRANPEEPDTFASARRECVRGLKRVQAQVTATGKVQDQHEITASAARSLIDAIDKEEKTSVVESEDLGTAKHQKEDQKEKSKKKKDKKEKDQKEKCKRGKGERQQQNDEKLQKRKRQALDKEVETSGDQ